MSNWSHVISFAVFKGTVLGGVGGIERATNTIVDVFAKGSSIGLGVITGLGTEEVTTEEVGPVPALLERTVVAAVGRESVAVDETTDGVTTAVLPSGIELSTKVTVSNVQLGLVDEPNDLNVARTLDDLNTLQGTFRNKTGAAAFLGAPGNFFALAVTNGSVGVRRSEDAEVVNVVHKASLAHGVLVLSRRVTDVVARLRTTVSSVLVDLVRNSGIRDDFVNERVRNKRLSRDISHCSSSESEFEHFQ